MDQDLSLSPDSKSTFSLIKLQVFSHQRAVKQGDYYDCTYFYTVDCHFCWCIFVFFFYFRNRPALTKQIKTTPAENKTKPYIILSSRDSEGGNG